MLRFVLGRLLMLGLVALTVSFIGFGLLRLSGDLAAVLAGETATNADIARVARQYGLDQPLYVQYLDWAGKALRGDLGVSLFTREPVIDLIMARIGTLFMQRGWVDAQAQMDVCNGAATLLSRHAQRLGF
jgi:peptide/nickel transport system permease protein